MTGTPVAAVSIKKIKRFRVAPRASAVLRNLRALMPAQVTPELENDIAAEAKSIDPLLSTAALYATYPAGQGPAWAEPLWLAESEEKRAPVALTVFAATVGLPMEQEVASALRKEEELRSRVLSALGEELADQAAQFVMRVVTEEARADGCELSDRKALPEGRESEALAGLDAGRVGIATQEGRLTPRFSRLGFILWWPPAKKRR